MRDFFEAEGCLGGCMYCLVFALFAGSYLLGITMVVLASVCAGLGAGLEMLGSLLFWSLPMFAYFLIVGVVERSEPREYVVTGFMTSLFFTCLFAFFSTPLAVCT